MALDTTSFPAYLRSLDLNVPVNTRPGRLIPGPPATVLELALRLGLGPLLCGHPRTLELLDRIGLRAEVLRAAAQRLRTRSMWLTVFEELARPHIADGQRLAAQGERAGAIDKLRAALTILQVGMSGDGYYFHTPMRERGRLLPLVRRLHRLLGVLCGDRPQRLHLSHAYGRTMGLLHLPRLPGGQLRHLPALVAFHPLGSEKETYASLLSLFRAAGYATLSLDLPGHGESFDGPRLRPNAEAIGVAALEALASHPAIDAERLGVMGGSLGAFFAQRTAAASPRVKACLAYASPFDLGYRLEESLPGVAECFSHVVGATTVADTIAAARSFHLRDVIDRIACPVCIVHGTQDHLCDFTISYEIASRLKAPVTVKPLIGVDHEAALPATPELAAPGIAWLLETL
jgi:pimeloyl-ACP methyl ester carboxylesterase